MTSPAQSFLSSVSSRSTTKFLFYPRHVCVYKWSLLFDEGRGRSRIKTHKKRLMLSLQRSKIKLTVTQLCFTRCIYMKSHCGALALRNRSGICPGLPWVDQDADQCPSKYTGRRTQFQKFETFSNLNRTLSKKKNIRFKLQEIKLEKLQHPKIMCYFQSTGRCAVVGYHT